MALDTERILAAGTVITASAALASPFLLIVAFLIL